MPLIVAAIVYGGAFFGYAATDTAHDSMKSANAVQTQYLQLKHAAIDRVAAETLKGANRG